jgi:hypothetical protein
MSMMMVTSVMIPASNERCSFFEIEFILELLVDRGRLLSFVPDMTTSEVEGVSKFLLPMSARKSPRSGTGYKSSYALHMPSYRSLGKKPDLIESASLV